MVRLKTKTFPNSNKMDVVILSVVVIVAVIVIKWSFSIRNQDRRIRGAIDLCEGNEKNRLYEVRQRLNTRPPDPGGGILSVSLFGPLSKPDKYKMYVKPLLQNAKALMGQPPAGGRPATQSYLPGWRIRVYLAPSTAVMISPESGASILDEFINHDCEVFVMENDPKNFEASMWRFLPAGEDIRFISMDADASVVPQAVAVHGEPGTTNINSFKINIGKWIDSGKTFFQRSLSHINVFVPISAGMWGGVGRPIPDIKQRMEKYCANWFGCDEAFLSREVFPLFKKHGFYRSGDYKELIAYFIIAVVVFGFLNVVAWRITKRLN